MSAETKLLTLVNDLGNSSLPNGESQEGRAELATLDWSRYGWTGQDVEFARALAGWLIKRRSEWREIRQPGTVGIGHLS